MASPNRDHLYVYLRMMQILSSRTRFRSLDCELSGLEARPLIQK